MVGRSASVNLPLHHEVQKFSSGTSSPGWSWKKGRKTVVWCGVVRFVHLQSNFRQLLTGRDVRKSLTPSLKSFRSSLKSSLKSFTSSPKSRLKSLPTLSCLPCLGRSFTNYVTQICVLWTHHTHVTYYGEWPMFRRPFARFQR